MKGTLNELQGKIFEELVKEIKYGGDVSIKSFSEKHFVSPSFLVKLSKKLGYSGFKELVFSLGMDGKMPKCMEAPDGTDYPHMIISNYSKELTGEFARKLLDARPYYIYAAARGYSGMVVEYMSQKLLAQGYRMVYMEGVHEISNHQNNIGILVSESGETEAVVEVARTFQNQGNYTIAFLSNGNSRLGRMVDLPIVISKWKDENKWGFSTFVPYSIIAFDLLFSNVQKEKQKAETVS